MNDESIWEGEHKGHRASVVLHNGQAVPLYAGNPHMFRTDEEAIMLAALRDIGLERVRTLAALRGDLEAFVADAERRWIGVPDWTIFDDEDGHGIVRTKDGGIVAETKFCGGTHQDAVRIVHARTDIPRLCIVVRGQGERIGALESENTELRLDVDENVAYGKLQSERIRVLEKERDEANVRFIRLEAACRNVLTTEPPPLKDVDGAWNKCVHMYEYRDWFHRQFNLTQVAELLESS
jgi:hypothetical protein